MWFGHEAYKAIVSLGMDVVPFIVGDFENYLENYDNSAYPGWWAMYALPEITGVRIGGPEVKSVDDVSRFWVKWLKEQNRENKEEETSRTGEEERTD